MSLSSTSTIKAALVTTLGARSSRYFETLQQFIGGRISRVEFDDSARQILDTLQLVQLHNALIISLFDAGAHHRVAAAKADAPQDAAKPPPKKKRRTLPYQGPDKFDTLRSARLKRWTIATGKRERDRVRGLKTAEPTESTLRVDEMGQERSVVLYKERGDPPGSRLPVQLCVDARGTSKHAIGARLNLIAAQHGLGAPHASVNDLMVTALEMKLKDLIARAITLTSSSRAISSISPSAPHTSNHHLNATSFTTFFDISPADLTTKSAAAMRLAMGDPEALLEEDQVTLLRNREVKDPRWQMFALLGERSTVKEAYRAALPTSRTAA